MSKKETSDSRSGPAADPITEALRRIYDKVAAEPIPEDLLKLIDQIDAKETDG